jgi:hypothetical protein
MIMRQIRSFLAVCCASLIKLPKIGFQSIFYLANCVRNLIIVVFMVFSTKKAIKTYKRNRLLAFVLLGGGIFALFSCVEPFNPTPVIETERVFWAYSSQKNQYYRSSASLLVKGNYCLVYGEDAKNISVSSARTVAEKFDKSIYPRITSHFGYPSDMDQNGRVIIFLLDIDEDTTYGYTAGYFNPNDFLNTIQSNRGEMLYINYKYGNNLNLYPTMAHELQHLINRSKHPNKSMDLWIDEGLSSAAEYLYEYKHQADRIEWFIADQQETIRKGNNFFIWNGYWENNSSDQLSNYATVYLFFQWLAIQASRGNAIYTDIINSPYTDYRAITSVVKQRITPHFSDIEDNEEGWAKILGAWYAANRLSITRPDTYRGIYSYKGEITLNLTWGYPAGSNHTVSLYPGEGVYSRISGSNGKNPSTEKESPIRYLGLDASSKTVDDAIPFDSSTYLLTYNGSINATSNAESGYVADLIPVPAAPLRSVAVASNVTTEPPEAILKRWDGGRLFLEKMQEGGTFPQD